MFPRVHVCTLLAEVSNNHPATRRNGNGHKTKKRVQVIKTDLCGVGRWDIFLRPNGGNRAALFKLLLHAEILADHDLAATRMETYLAPGVASKVLRRLSSSTCTAGFQRASASIRRDLVELSPASIVRR